METVKQINELLGIEAKSEEEAKKAVIDFLKTVDISEEDGTLNGDEELEELFELAEAMKEDEPEPVSAVEEKPATTSDDEKKEDGNKKPVKPKVEKKVSKPKTKRIPSLEVKTNIEAKKQILNALPEEYQDEEKFEHRWLKYGLTVLYLGKSSKKPVFSIDFAKVDKEKEQVVVSFFFNSVRKEKEIWGEFEEEGIEAFSGGSLPHVKKKPLKEVRTYFDRMVGETGKTLNELMLEKCDTTDKKLKQNRDALEAKMKKESDEEKTPEQKLKAMKSKKEVDEFAESLDLDTTSIEKLADKKKAVQDALNKEDSKPTSENEEADKNQESEEAEA